jgi:hypothetical protein
VLHEAIGNGELHEEFTVGFIISHWPTLAEDLEQEPELHKLVLALQDSTLGHTLCNGVPYPRLQNRVFHFEHASSSSKSSGPPFSRCQCL